VPAAEGAEPELAVEDVELAVEGPESAVEGAELAVLAPKLTINACSKIEAVRAKGISEINLKEWQREQSKRFRGRFMSVRSKGQVPPGARRHVIVPAKSKKLLVKKSVANWKMARLRAAKSPFGLGVYVCSIHIFSTSDTPLLDSVSLVMKRSLVRIQERALFFASLGGELQAAIQPSESPETRDEVFGKLHE
jgi:hypothetical protein